MWRSSRSVTTYSILYESARIRDFTVINWLTQKIIHRQINNKNDKLFKALHNFTGLYAKNIWDLKPGLMLTAWIFVWNPGIMNEFNFVHVAFFI